MILRSLFILGLAVAFAAWRLSGIDVLTPSDAVPAAAAVVSDAETTEVVDIPAESAFSAMVERPLFREDRRPPAAVPIATAVVETPTPPTPEPVWRLIGIGKNDKGPIALLLPPGGTETLRARSGDVHGSWTVLSIGDGEVTLQNDESGDMVQLSLEPGE